MRRLLIILVSVVFAATAARGADKPQDVVDRLNRGLLEVMQQAQELGFEGRVLKLQETLGGTYHLPVMAKAAAGRHWRRLKEDQRQRLTAAFTQMTLAIYADRFSGYSGETFEILEAVPTIKDLILVKTHLVKSNGDVVKLNYLTRRYDAGWRIVDVYLDAKYSELARLKAEFSSVLRSGGFDELLAKIEQRTNTAAASGG